MRVDYAAVAQRLLKTSAKIAKQHRKQHGKQHRLAWSQIKHGKNVVCVDGETQNAPARSPPRGRLDTFTLKACIDSLQRELDKVEAIAATLNRESAR